MFLFKCSMKALEEWESNYLSWRQLKPWLVYQLYFLERTVVQYECISLFHFLNYYSGLDLQYLRLSLPSSFSKPARMWSSGKLCFSFKCICNVIWGLFMLDWYEQVQSWSSSSLSLDWKIKKIWNSRYF